MFCLHTTNHHNNHYWQMVCGFATKQFVPHKNRLKWHVFLIYAKIDMTDLILLQQGKLEQLCIWDSVYIPIHNFCNLIKIRVACYNIKYDSCVSFIFFFIRNDDSSSSCNFMKIKILENDQRYLKWTYAFI